MANTLKTPKVMPSEFCADGDKNDILASPSTSDPQLANFSTGFPAITQTPIPNGGIPPERADFNGMFNLLSSALVYIQNGGQWTFVPEVSNAIGGYPAGAILNYYDATNKVNKRVISNINNNVNNFLLDPSQIGDSSKPWSYTESTPIVQNLDNPSADTVPSTTAVSNESSRIMSIMNNKVDKSGDTMTGTLSNTARTALNVINENYNDDPTTTFYGTEIRISSTDDKNNVWFCGSKHPTTNDLRARILAQRVINGTRYYSEIYAGVGQTGNLYTYAPKCNALNSIVTTIYVSANCTRFGNGVQICIGTGTGAQTFEQPFRDANYMIADSDQTYHKYEGMWTTGKTTTGFTINNSGNANWIAIGRWY